MLVAMAALGLGWMTLARVNFAPAVAVFGLSFLLWRHIPLRHRLAQVALAGMISAGLLAGYILLIQIPSTGTRTLSCVAGQNLVFGSSLKEIPLRASNGPQSSYYAGLLTLESVRQSRNPVPPYAFWRRPGPWVSEVEQTSFIAQPIGVLQEEIRIHFPMVLYWHMGICRTDALLYGISVEAISRHFDIIVLETVKAVGDMVILHPSELSLSPLFLEQPQRISWKGDGIFGFYRAESKAYNGHRIWRPGVIVYSALFPLLNMAKLLTPFAMLAAYWRRDWLLVTIATLMLVSLTAIAVATVPDPLHIAMLAPLYSILIGWFLAQLLERILASRAAQRVFAILR